MSNVTNQAELYLCKVLNNEQLKRMESKDRNIFKVLNEISRLESDLNQRKIASKLSISLGLANSLLKKMVSKGYVKISNVQGNKMKYLLTAKGIAEKSRLTYTYLKYSINLYKDSFDKIYDLLEFFVSEGYKKVVFLGVSEITEIALFVSKEIDVEIIAVIDNEYAGMDFMGFTVKELNNLIDIEFDSIVATKYYDLKELDLSYFTLSKIYTF